MALRSPPLDEGEVVADRSDARLVGERSVAGHDGLDVHPEDQVARRDPVRQRPGPDDRRASDEQDVAGVDRLRVGDVGERVAGGVGRADLDQLDDTAADLELEPAVERAGRQRELDAVELEVAEEAAEEVADLARRMVQRRQHRRRHLGHLVGGGARGHDLGAVHELVAVAVVAVGMGVHHGARSAPTGWRRPSTSSIAAVRRRSNSVSTSSDDPVADDQAGVAPAPPTVRLEVGEAPVAELVQPVLVAVCQSHPAFNSTSGALWRRLRMQLTPLWRETTSRCRTIRRMRQLSGVDVSFLNMETPTVFGHVSSLNLYDPTGAPGGGGLEATKQLILERIDELAPFRRRLVEVPLGLDLPYWVEDPDFDIDFHVRHHAVPPPGTPEQLGEVVSRIIARPLDRKRPLWELYVIEGVDGGKLIAQLTKVHHATIDGASGALMLASDPRHRPRFPSGRRADALGARADPERPGAVAPHRARVHPPAGEVRPSVGPRRCARWRRRRSPAACGSWRI